AASATRSTTSSANSEAWTRQASSRREYTYTMAMNIRDPETERLATEVAELVGETKTAAVRASLRERRDRLLAQRDLGHRLADARRFMEEEIWSQVPLGMPITKAERAEILGYGPDGV